MTRPLLTFRITADYEDRKTPVYVKINLYREEDGLIWRLDGQFGDECETLPRPTTVAEAKDDARLSYPTSSPFRPVARWMK